MTKSEHSQDTHSTIPVTDPFALFDIWMAAAEEGEPNDANAMALATASPDGAPSVLMVLLKGHGPQETSPLGGFTFYTNTESRKGLEIMANRQASLLFHWKSLRRQIRIDGPLTQVSEETATAYFHSRSRTSQLGAVASDQSRPMPDRATFLERFAAVEEEFEGREVERPTHWTGFTVAPHRIEFWQDRPGRLHDRRVFTRTGLDAAGHWADTLLYP